MSECEELCGVSKYTAAATADRETDDTVSVVTGHDNSVVAATLDYDVGVDNNDNNDDKKRWNLVVDGEDRMTIIYY